MPFVSPLSLGSWIIGGHDYEPNISTMCSKPKAEIHIQPLEDCCSLNVCNDHHHSCTLKHRGEVFQCQPQRVKGSRESGWPIGNFIVLIQQDPWSLVSPSALPVTQACAFIYRNWPAADKIPSVLHTLFKRSAGTDRAEVERERETNRMRKTTWTE